LELLAELELEQLQLLAQQIHALPAELGDLTGQRALRLLGHGAVGPGWGHRFVNHRGAPSCWAGWAARSSPKVRVASSVVADRPPRMAAGPLARAAGPRPWRTGRARARSRPSRRRTAPADARRWCGRARTTSRDPACEAGPRSPRADRRWCRADLR